MSFLKEALAAASSSLFVVGVIIFLIGVAIVGVLALNAANRRAGIFGLVIIVACGVIGWRVAHPRAR
ncbi:hypothetical protein [Cutibacterium modestum]|uniref:hypothetical protein n=1 Tax=Cutibacterium modestum TaxID=2559073 RepID=UPI000207004F|nr:hypothetical protein [Cutibacterium modestum]AOH45087.1 hypothetical protein BCB70_03255 [Cutibacterium modestum]EGG27576.1 hypothetical protein PA08_0535 [Cutibacterium modestum P08]MCP2376043.1 hypothetical protein [Cutibacterium modestum 28N]MCP2378080.1 hypothetical protein [Cutibacterium modestum 31N]MCP2381394.1 hypothetical protein [Cutibacterium modestum 30N]